MTLRVGLVISTHHSGGGEQYLLRLYRGLAEDDVVEPLLLGRLDGWEELGFDAVDIGLGPKWSFRTVPRLLTSALSERRRALRRIRVEHQRRPFDVFHLQYKREQLLLTRALARLAPVVWTEHGRLPTGVKGRLLAPFYRRAACGTKRIIGVSVDVVEDVRRCCRRDVDAVAIENAIDENVFRPPGDAAELRGLKRQFGLDPDGIVASVVTRLHPKKRVDRAIRLLSSDDAITLLIAGDGPDADRLRAIAEGRPVRFLGWMDDPSAVHRVSDISILALTEQGEGFPTTLVEAAASGCVPVGFEGDMMADEVIAAGGAMVPAGALLSATGLTDNLEARRSQAIEWAGGRGLRPWLDAHSAVLVAAVDLTS